MADTMNFFGKVAFFRSIESTILESLRSTEAFQPESGEHRLVKNLAKS